MKTKTRKDIPYTRHSSMEMAKVGSQAVEDILGGYSSSFIREAAQDASAGWASLVLVRQDLPKMWKGYHAQASKWCGATASM